MVKITTRSEYDYTIKGSSKSRQTEEVVPSDATVVEFVQTVYRRAIEDQGEQLKVDIAEATNRVMSRFFQWVAHTFMLGYTTSTMWQALQESGVRYTPLSRKYVERKFRSPGSRIGFWWYTGKLYDQFNRPAHWRSNFFGVADVGFIGSRGFRRQFKVTVGSETLDLFTVKGRSAVDWETLENAIRDASGIGSKTAWIKLQNHERSYRPLVGPALTYYLKHLVRDGMATELKKMGYEVSIYQE